MNEDESRQAEDAFGSIPHWFVNMRPAERGQVMRLMAEAESPTADTDVISIQVRPERHGPGGSYQVGPEVKLVTAVPRAGGAHLQRMTLSRMLDQVFDGISGRSQE